MSCSRFLSSLGPRTGKKENSNRWTACDNDAALSNPSLSEAERERDGDNPRDRPSGSPALASSDSLGLQAAALAFRASLVSRRPELPRSRRPPRQMLWLDGRAETTRELVQS